MRRFGTAWLLLACVLACAAACAVEPMATRLTPDLRVYPQFFSIAQDPARQIYLGGTDGIARNDGGRWSWLPAPKRGPVRALHVDDGGRLWYGGSDTFGYLRTLPTGEQVYVDLAPQFARELGGQGFSDVWTIRESHGTVWFAALHDLFAVDAGGRRVGYWHRSQRFGEMQEIAGALWVQWRGEGLRRWDGGDFVPVPGTQVFGGSPIDDLFPLADGSVLVHDVASGLSLWKQGVVTRLDDPALRGDVSHLSQGLALGGGRFAFAGDDGRVRVFDLTARRFESVALGSGFISDVVLDRDGALLAVDDQGAVRMPWPPRWSHYGSADGLTGDVHTLAQVDGRVFVCSGAGVQETAMATAGLALPLRDRDWSPGECWQVYRAGDALLFAESRSLLRVDGERPVPVSADDLYPRVLLTDAADPARLWVGTEHGPALLQREGAGFREVGRIDQTGWRITTLAPAPQGVWLGSENRGLFLARTDAKSPQGFTVEAWGTEHGLLVGDSGETNVAALPEGTFVSTGRGLFHYANGRFAMDDAGGLRALLEDGEIVHLQAADNGDRWAFSYHTLYRRSAGGHWQVALVGNPAIGAFETLLPLQGGDALIGGGTSVVLFRHPGTTPAAAAHPTVRVTAVRLNREGRPPQLMPLDHPPQVQPRGGSLDFDLAFSDFDALDDKQYQVRLEGFSKGWSAWSRQSSYRFFALPPGEYALHVRARREYDSPVEGAPFRFTIVPRWYEHRWIVPLAVLLLSSLVAAGLVQRQRLRVRHLRERNLELDRLVRARTQDLERVNLRLKDLADRDGLTDIANRRRFDDYLALCIRRAREMGQPLGLAMVDVDHFKQFNDAHGHQAGDDMLRRVARLLGDGVRGDTLVARYGGEEFAILLPQLDARGATGVAHRLMTELEQLAIPHAASPTASRLTASMGIACMVPGEHSLPADLIQVADALLYQAKAEGRNCYRVGGADCVA